MSKEERQQAVAETVQNAKRIAGEGPIDRSRLARILEQLVGLASRRTLWTENDYPPPGDDERQARYLIQEDPDHGFALYLNVMRPGKQITPHNHTTWAVIVAVEGQEVNRIYARTDDRSDPARARIHVARELTVQPGAPIAFLPDDIHSIHVVGTEPTLHFHLYGQPLETLTGRVAIDPETGEVKNYNAAYFRPSEAVA